MTREEKIRFLEELKNGNRSLNELRKVDKRQGGFFVQNFDGKYLYDGKSLTADEIKAIVPGNFIFIENPHLSKQSKKELAL